MARDQRTKNELLDENEELLDTLEQIESLAAEADADDPSEEGAGRKLATIEALATGALDEGEDEDEGGDEDVDDDSVGEVDDGGEED